MREQYPGDGMEQQRNLAFDILSKRVKAVTERDKKLRGPYFTEDVRFGDNGQPLLPPIESDGKQDAGILAGIRRLLKDATEEEHCE